MSLDVISFSKSCLIIISKKHLPQRCLYLEGLRQIRINKVFFRQVRQRKKIICFHLSNMIRFSLNAKKGENNINSCALG